MDVKFRVDSRSLSRLMSRLKRVEPGVRRQVLTKGTQAAAKVQRAAIRSAAPTRTGALKQSLRLKRVRYSNKSTVGFKVRPDSKFERVLTVNAKGRTKLASKKASAEAIATAKANKDSSIRKIKPSKYAHLVEYGTVRSRPSWFARTAKATVDQRAFAAFLQTAQATLRTLLGK